jgi:flagellar biosynthesis/type III secretory pathway M-ring protein FliF/YscJ
MDLFSTGYTADDLVAQVTTAGQTTLASIAPVLAVVVGLILAFIVGRWIISLFRHAGRTSGR